MAHTEQRPKKKRGELEEAIRAYQLAGRPESLRNMIALANAGLIVSALKSRKENYFSRNWEELEQEGFILLLNCIDKFNADLGYSFSTYFYQSMLSLFRNTLEYNQDLSLDEEVKGFEGENLTLLDTIEDEEAGEPFEEVERDGENQAIREEVKKTLGDESQILFDYYGIGTKPLLYKEIGEKNGCSTSFASGKARQLREKLSRNINLKRIYYEYDGIPTFNSSSIITFGGNTGYYSSPTENAAIKRMEYIERLKAEYIEKIRNDKAMKGV